MNNTIKALRNNCVMWNDKIKSYMTKLLINNSYKFALIF